MQKAQHSSAKPSTKPPAKPGDRPALRNLLDWVVKHAQQKVAAKRPPASPLVQEIFSHSPNLSPSIHKKSKT